MVDDEQQRHGVARALAGAEEVRDGDVRLHGLLEAADLQLHLVVSRPRATTTSGERLRRSTPTATDRLDEPGNCGQDPLGGIGGRP